MYTCKQIGLSGGLKPIEQAIGVERDRPDISGEDAVRLWREHERGQDGSLETLISYKPRGHEEPGDARRGGYGAVARGRVCGIGKS